MSRGPGPPAQSDAAPSRLSTAAARRRLGRELRGLRERARMSLAEAGAALERSQATMSRVENGATTVRAVDVERLLDVYRDSGVDAVDDALRTRLLELLAVGRLKEWFSAFRDVTGGDMTDEHVETFISYETYAERLCNFEPELIPGLLQTREYARAVTDARFPEHTEHQRARLVELRTERRRTLEKQGSPRLDFVIGEPALGREIGGPETMAGQLAAVEAEIRDGSSQVGVRILPATVAIPAAIGGPFVVLTFADPEDHPVVYLESRAGATYLSDPADVADHQAEFAALVEASYSAEDALERVKEIARKIG